MIFNRLRRGFLYSFLPITLIITYFLSQKDWRSSLKNPRPLSYYYRNESDFGGEFKVPKSCFHLLSTLNTPLPSLLIDSEILQKIDKNECQTTEKPMIQIGVDEIYKSQKSQWNSTKFEIVFYKNSTNRDYLEFQTEPRKIIPKNFPVETMNNLQVPTHIQQFLEFQKRSKFIPCRNITVTRDSENYRFLSKFRRKSNSFSAEESIDNLAKLRDEILSFGMFPFLNGGTLLGWYRECSVIPHTHDMDISIFGEEWNEEFYEFLWSYNSSFTVKRQLGLINDSYELTVTPKTGSGRQIDVFLMYKGSKNGQEYRWVGGVSSNGDKFKYIYPPYDPYCAGEMMGRMFWVTCSPEQNVLSEYGPSWKLDKNSSKYVWYAAKNAEKNGKFTREQMETDAYNEYQ